MTTNSITDFRIGLQKGAGGKIIAVCAKYTDDGHSRFCSVPEGSSEQPEHYDMLNSWFEMYEPISLKQLTVLMEVVLRDGT